MKKIIVVIALMMVLILSACSEAQIKSGEQNTEMLAVVVENVEENSETVQDGNLSEDQEIVQLSTQMRLILGSLSLDEANLGLSPEQANSLLPLWKVMKSLLSSDTAAAGEIEALFNQIQSVLTPEQLEWVTNYNISPVAYQEILTELVPEEFLNNPSLMTEEEREEKRATAIAANGGTIPQELQGGSGRGMGGGSGIPRSMSGETPGSGTGAGQGSGGGAGLINTYLIDGLLAKLELILNP
ncbi:MAG TPA: hypothetical protein VK856_08800 [Anaerolineaceae bacterium]|nr:hypothetical protein [Anaerolineaceae bacterium]